MSLSDLEFFIIEALIGMRRSSVMMLIAIATVSVSLVVFGLFLLLTVNISHLTNFMSDKLEIRVFLKENLTPNEINVFQESIAKLNGVREVTFISKDQAFKMLKESYANIQFDDLLEQNPLPNSIRVKLNNNSNIQNVAQILRDHTYYAEDVQYGGIVAERIQVVSQIIRVAGIVLVGLLSLATLLIVFNTIRLTILARTNEITIMHLVGATEGFIKGPFLVEGLIMGLLGAVLAIVFLKSTYVTFAIQFQNAIPFFPLVFNEATLNKVYFTVGFTGPALGILGAYLSVSKTIKAQIKG
jgi:cell division transport system permease protein